MKIEPLKIQVRFSDLDILGHVNNVIYLSYFEMARIHYFTALVGPKWDWFNEGVLLVKNNVEYHLPILLHDQPTIHLFVEKIGNSSVVYRLGVFKNSEEAICALGQFTHVYVDRQTHRPQSIPQNIRVVLESLRL